MESLITTVTLVLIFVILLVGMGVVGALLVAGARQIVDEIESREWQHSDETTPGSSPVASQTGYR